MPTPASGGGGTLSRTSTGALSRTISALASALDISRDDAAQVSAALPQYSLQHLHRMLEGFALSAGGDGTIGRDDFRTKLAETTGADNPAMLGFSDAMFDAFDADGSGRIDTIEYHLSLAALWRGDARAKHDFIFRCLDTGNSGSISFEQFYSFFKSTLAAVGRVNQAKKLGLDEDNPLYGVFAMAQIEAEKKEAEQVFKAIDADHDGQVSREEFTAALDRPASVGSPHLKAVVDLMALFKDGDDEASQPSQAPQQEAAESGVPPAVRVVLGTMTMGPAVGTEHMDGQHTEMPSYCQTPPDVAVQQLQALIECPAARVASGPEAGKVLVDTASAYQNWCTESTLGAIFTAHPELRSQVSIHSKANSGQLPHKSLSKESVLYQCNGSLERLQSSHIDIYYLHGPDIATPIEESLEAIKELHESGKIKEFGLSNFPAWKVADIYHRCKSAGICAPTVYQGCYNALTRSIEYEATACFRELGIRSYHYNPLAGGMLAGKYSGIDDALKEGGRFGSKSPISGAAYSARFWHQQYFDALEGIRTACSAANIPMAAAALRWLLHHSVLSGEHHDGIIFGASSSEHCKLNLAACSQGPLPDTIVEAFSAGWAITAPVSTGYFRGYDRVPGRSHQFLAKFQSKLSAPL